MPSAKRCATKLASLGVVVEGSTTEELDQGPARRPSSLESHQAPMYRWEPTPGYTQMQAALEVHHPSGCVGSLYL